MMASLAKQEAAVQNYLTTGEHDPCHYGWPGGNLFAAAQAGDAALRSALVAQLRSRTAAVTMPPALPSELHLTDLTALTRTRVAPMVGGLFPPHEQAAVLAMLERSVIFLTPDNIESVLLSTPWLHTAWSLANLYLASVGADMLSQDARAIVGLSEVTTCYVSVEYFRDHDPCADYVVHEAAHIFHNCKRATVGLPETRRREWLLDIDFGQRETFAYACEAYSRILTLGRTRAERQAALAAHGDGPVPGHDSVDTEEYLDILGEAVEARNGWKRILQRCAPRRAPRPGATALTTPA
jgi:hypothetical protein